MKKYNLSFKLSLIILGGMVFTNMSAQHLNDTEKIKCQILLYLTNNIEWSDSKKEVTIGVLGTNDNLTHKLAKLSSERKCKKTVRIVKFETFHDVRNCDILFITKESIEESLLLSDNIVKKTFVVTDGDVGQAMSIINKNGQMTFHINPEVIAETNFKLSSNVMLFASR